jgi:hypothetical protein
LNTEKKANIMSFEDIQTGMIKFFTDTENTPNKCSIHNNNELNEALYWMKTGCEAVKNGDESYKSLNAGIISLENMIIAYCPNLNDLPLWFFEYKFNYMTYKDLRNHIDYFRDVDPLNPDDTKPNDSQYMKEGKLLLLYIFKTMDEHPELYLELVEWAKDLQNDIMNCYVNKNDAEDWIRNWKPKF